MGLAFLITAEKLQLLGERKVLKEAEYAALLDASAVIETARREARRVAEQAAADAAAARDAGYRDGVRQAEQAYAQRLVEDGLSVQRQLQALRASMAQIVVKAVGQFITDAEPEELFEAALLRVDALLRNEPFVTVRVAPASEPRVRTALARLGQQVAWAANVLVTQDDTLVEGACVVQTASGRLEIGVDAQIAAFRKAIERSGANPGTEAAR